MAFSIYLLQAVLIMYSIFFFEHWVVATACLYDSHFCVWCSKSFRCFFLLLSHSYSVLLCLPSQRSPLGILSSNHFESESCGAYWFLSDNCKQLVPVWYQLICCLLHLSLPSWSCKISQKKIEQWKKVQAIKLKIRIKNYMLWIFIFSRLKRILT